MAKPTTFDPRALAQSIPVFSLPAEVPVSAWAIRDWCNAMGVTDPIYRDATAASRAGHPGIVAPPPMLQTWVLMEVMEHPGSPFRLTRAMMIEAGFPSVVATNYELTSSHLVKVGDRITTHIRHDSISDEKVTPLGTGYFVTEAHAWENQDGTKLGELKIRVFYFRKSAGVAASAEQKAKAAAKSPVTPSGHALAPLTLPVTATLIVTGALASNDFEVIHHDRDTAQAMGLPDIIMNVTTSMGLVFRYVSEAAPGAMLKNLALRLGYPACPHDTLVFSGSVQEEPGRGERNFMVSGMNGTREHVQAKVTMHSS